MSLWGKNSANTSQKPKYANAAMTVVGVTAAGAHANGVTHSGWVQTTKGKGPVKSITVSAGGTGYSNGGAVTAANTNGSGFAGTITTNGAGAIVSITITAGGSYTTAPVLTAAGGSNAALTAVMGGRANRVMKETLVAGGSMV